MTHLLKSPELFYFGSLCSVFNYPAIPFFLLFIALLTYQESLAFIKTQHCRVKEEICYELQLYVNLVNLV